MNDCLMPDAASVAARAARLVAERLGIAGPIAASASGTCHQLLDAERRVLIGATPRVPEAALRLAARRGIAASAVPTLVLVLHPGRDSFWDLETSVYAAWCPAGSMLPSDMIEAELGCGRDGLDLLSLDGKRQLHAGRDGWCVQPEPASLETWVRMRLAANGLWQRWVISDAEAA